MSATKEYKKAYYWANRERCIQYLKKYRAGHERQYTSLIRLAGYERRHFLKLQVLSHYSNPLGIPICNNCGEMDVDVLCLDHIKGGGRKHMDKLTMTLYNWVVRNNFPAGFQVLCANCNLRKARLEYKGITPELSTVEFSTN